MGKFFQEVSLRDSKQSIASMASECKTGITLHDMAPQFYNRLYKDQKTKRMHDANFAFVMSKLSKLHNLTYEPLYNTTYAQDIPIEVGGGMVDFVDYFSVEWAGMPTESQNLTGNNVNVVPRVNAKLNHEAVPVYNFEIAYDIKFVEIDKLNKLQFTKSLEAIYKDAILAGWDLFCDKISYFGANGNDGLFTSPKIHTTILPQGTQDATQKGFKSMKDEEIVATINGIMSYYLINSNNNLDLLPDVFLMPQTDAAELTGRYSDLFTNTLRQFLMVNNIGIDEMKAAGLDGYLPKFRGRARLESMGTNEAGRIVTYKYDKKYVRLDITYPVQMYYTAPNIDKLCYTTFFVGQVSALQFPYNEKQTEVGAVSYWDFAKPTSD
jgi:hypothetical protein